jgi:hypothetical protein
VEDKASQSRQKLTKTTYQGASMNDDTGTAVPRSFWIISAVALVWNLLGVAAYVQQMTLATEVLEAMPLAERALYENIPVWATSAFALAVNGGALGCLLLLFRKAWAIPVLIVSLVGVIVQMIHAFFLSKSIEVYGPAGMIMPAMVIAVSAYLVWYSRVAREKGWIS